MRTFEKASPRAPLAPPAPPRTLLVTGAAGCRAAESRDPLADEIARWSADLEAQPSKIPALEQIRRDSAPGLARAAEALRDGRRLLAFERLAAARTNLAAAV